MRQHLTAVLAAAAVGSARVEGAEVGSRELAFEPGDVTGGDYEFAIGTAGSTTLVLQTVLPPLLLASRPSRLVLRGGTHNRMAPPFDYLQQVFLPLVSRMGPRVEATLVRHGFYPAGGGEWHVTVDPAPLRRLDLLERGEVRRRSARAIVSRLPLSIAERELATVAKLTGWPPEALSAGEVEAHGPGNVVMLEVESEHLTELFAGFGERGVAAEVVAEGAAREALRYLAAGVPVGEHLADQLLLPMALAGGGSFRTLPLSRHATTNAEVIQRFLPVAVRAERGEDGTCLVEVGAPLTDEMVRETLEKTRR